MKITAYYEQNVRLRRPEIQDKWLEKAIENPEFIEVQPNGRIRHYIYISEYDKFLRVVLDNGAVLNAFLDRRFKPKRQ